MGKVAAAEMKKKKGRPSLSDLQKRTLKQQEEETLTSSSPNFNISNRRSTRRNPNLDGVSPTPQWIDGEGDDDDERKEKKVKLVVRLPHSNQHYHQPGSSANSFSLNSVSYGSDSNADAENHEASPKKRKINVVGDRSGGDATDEGEKVSKAMDTLPGSRLESGPTTPLPDKKLLVFILDRLQKKDTYGVFSEPVDLNELPDYREIIEHPMDFGTVRKKLDEGLYSNLEVFEADVLLICSNAMQYNAPDTIYFRQARSIQELAKRDFENLRQVSEDGEPRPKIVRRGRPPSKNSKKPPGKPPFERLGPELASDATLATGGDNSIGSNSYNLRRAPIAYGVQSTNSLVKDFHQSRNNETCADWHEWNEEFPASILKAEAKYGRKQYPSDENRRATYEQFHPSTFGQEPSVLTTFNGHMKQLLGVGLHLDHSYARSLARFAANLGAAVWKVASKKIENVLPTGLNFGPGWVGENEALQQPMPFLSEGQKSSNNSANDGHPGIPITASTSCLNPVATYGSSFNCKEGNDEAATGLNSHSELAVLKSGFGGSTPGPSHSTWQRPVLHPDRNGFNGVFGYGLPSQMGMVRHAMPTGQPGLEEASVPSKMLEVVSRGNATSVPPMSTDHIISEEPKFAGSSKSANYGNLAPESRLNSHAGHEAGISGKQSSQGFSPHRRQYPLPVPPDLNVIFQAPGSPSSSFQIGSPQQPDLALQL